MLTLWIRILWFEFEFGNGNLELARTQNFHWLPQPDIIYGKGFLNFLQILPACLSCSLLAKTSKFVDSISYYCTQTIVNKELVHTPFRSRKTIKANYKRNCTDCYFLVSTIINFFQLISLQFGFEQIISIEVKEVKRLFNGGNDFQGTPCNVCNTKYAENGN